MLQVDARDGTGGGDGDQAEGPQLVNDAQEQDRLAARGLDVTVPNVARIYDFILGGKDNFDADRAAAAQLLAVIPGGSAPARMNRAFLGRVVYFLAAERGIRQFLDIGSGLPTASNVHEIAQAADPDARVVYVDSDPVVVLHAQAILEDRAKGVAAVRGDLRDPAGITATPAVRELIDFSQPVAVLLFAVLHFVPDADDPRALLARFGDVMAPGSALALSHITDENIDEEAARAGRAVYQNASAPIVPRSRAQIEGLFDGLDLLPPGVTDISHWPEHDPGGAALHFYGGVAVKPSALPNRYLATLYNDARLWVMSPRPAPDLDLRRDQVIRAARDLAESDGWPAVTMRRLAGDLGVTQPVVYSVFDGRQALIDAVALNGFSDLAAALEAADASPMARMRAYLDFAAARPRVYEAMFSLPSELAFATEDTPDPLRRAFRGIRDAFPAGDETQAEVAWSAMHGLATLQASGRLRPSHTQARLDLVDRLLTEQEAR
jgi:AcrR family transcriptional regulator